MIYSLLILGLVVSLSLSSDPQIEEEEIHARTFMQIIENRDGIRKSKVAKAKWNYASNATEENLKKLRETQSDASMQKREDWQEITKYSWRVFNDYELKRKFEKYSVVGYEALPKEVFVKRRALINHMQDVYRKIKICDFQSRNKCDLSQEPEIVNIFKHSSDPEELKFLWIEWRKKTSILKSGFREYVSLSNEAARFNNLTDNSELWVMNFRISDVRQQIDKLLEQIKPFYLQLHAYVRYQLRKKYGNDVVPEKGPIPAHLLGSMWGENWENVENFTRPFEGKINLDPTEEMISQNFTPHRMFKLAEEFLVSMNLSSTPPIFWERSIFENPEDGRPIICDPSSYDFFDGNDYRVIQCSQINEQNWDVVHQLMGQIQYYLQYKNQPIAFREAATVGFLRAIGGVVSLSASTTKHLRNSGLLLNNTEYDSEVFINKLYKVSLSKIASMLFSYVVDTWRLGVFSGNITEKDYNCRWWEIREEYQGIAPPVERTMDDFDPASHKAVLEDESHLEVFVSTVLQFQIYRSLCEKSGEYERNDSSKKLYECDLYNNTEAGNRLAKMLEMGSSRPWPDVLENLTGNRELDAASLLEYFEPLTQWLKNENKKNFEHVGWESSKKHCLTKEQSQEERKIT